MKNIDNALADVLANYKLNTLDYDITKVDTQDAWIVNVYNREAPGSLLKIEVIDDYGIPKCCVLQKTNVGRRSMFKFMNLFVDALE